MSIAAALLMNTLLRRLCHAGAVPIGFAIDIKREFRCAHRSRHRPAQIYIDCFRFGAEIVCDLSDRQRNMKSGKECHRNELADTTGMADIFPANTTQRLLPTHAPLRSRASVLCLDHAKELLEFRRLGIGKNIFRRADLVHAALMHEDDARADVAGKLHFMRHHQQGHAFLCQFAHDG